MTVVIIEKCTIRGWTEDHCQVTSEQPPPLPPTFRTSLFARPASALQILLLSLILLGDRCLLVGLRASIQAPIIVELEASTQTCALGVEKSLSLACALAQSGTPRGYHLPAYARP